MSECNARRHLLRLSLEAVLAGSPFYVVLMLLLFLGQRALTVEALTGLGFLQTRVHAHTPVEHETLAVVMLSTALREIIENAAVELKDILEAFALHERPGLLAPDAARAKHHNRLLFQFRRELADGLREIAELLDADRQRVS